MSKVVFLKEVLRSAKTMGAVAPYNKKVGQLVNSKIMSIGKGSSLVEIGPGTGAITENLLGNMHEGNSFLLELNPSFVKHLRKRFPALKTHQGSLENLNDFLAKEKMKKVDNIVCSIPWSYYDKKFHQHSLQLISDNLTEGGQFITVTNLPSLLLKSGRAFRKELNKHFKTVKTSKMVWSNLPPAFCYVCSN